MLNQVEALDRQKIIPEDADLLSTLIGNILRGELGLDREESESKNTRGR